MEGRFEVLIRAYLHHGLLKCPHSPFRLPVTLRVVRGSCMVVDTETGAKIMKLLRNELWSIVGDDGERVAMSTEYG